MRGFPFFSLSPTSRSSQAPSSRPAQAPSSRPAVTKVVSALGVGLLCFSTSTFATPSLVPQQRAYAQSADQSVDAHLWGLDSNRVGADSPLTVEVRSVTPRTPGIGDTLTTTVAIKNRSENVVSNIIVRLQRGEVLSDASRARLALAEPEGTYATVTDFTAGFSLAPDEARDLTLTVPISTDSPAGLGITSAGVYPLLVNVNGQPDGDIDKLLAETRTLLPVVGAAEQTDSDGDRDTATEQLAENSPQLPSEVPFSLVYPLVERVPVLPGETGEAPQAQELIVSEESLGVSVSPGGRLHALLDELDKGFTGRGGESLHTATCIAIDPETLDAIARMSNGYLVGATRPSPVENSRRLRDSWNEDDRADLAEGAYTEAADQWLDRLHHVAQDTCIVALPWASANISSIADSRNPDLAREALASSQQVVAKHLGVPVLAGVYLPSEGYVTAQSAPLFAKAQQFSAIDPSAAYETSQPLGDDPAPASVIVAANNLVTNTGVLAAPGQSGALDSQTTAFAVSAPLSEALAATGNAPEVAGYSDVTSRYDLRLDSSAARLQTSIGTLYQELYDVSARTADSEDQATPEVTTPGETVSEETTPEDSGPLFAQPLPAPIVAVPPAHWSVSAQEARTWLAAVSQLMDSGAMQPVPLADSLRMSSAHNHIGPVTPREFPFDPGATDSQVSDRIRHTSAEIDDVTHFMANTPNVALTRYDFTRPLRLDLIRSVSAVDRRRLEAHRPVANKNHELRDATDGIVAQLRDSVELVAPGGVYTRATGMSPIVVVGRNGLPLPVPAFVRVAGNGVLSQRRYDAYLPAQGSVTVQFTPDSPELANSNTMSMWLENTNEQRISSTVTVSIQSGASIAAVVGLTVITLVIGGYFAIKRSRQFRK